MSDEGAGHKSFVAKDRLGSMLLKCNQHCGSGVLFDVVLFCLMCYVCLIINGDRVRGRAGVRQEEPQQAFHWGDRIRKVLSVLAVRISEHIHTPG